MGVDGKSGLAKGHVEHHVGGFSSDTGQGLQRRARAWDFTAVQIEQHLTGLQHMPGLAAVQANRLDVRLQTFQAEV